MRSLFAAVAALLAGAAPAAAHVTLWASTPQNTLLRFRSDTPGTISKTLVVTGLQPFEQLQAIAFEPRSGIMFAVALDPGLPDSDDDTARMYVINLRTGAATQVALLSQDLADTYDLDGRPPAMGINVESGPGGAQDPNLRFRIATYSGENFTFDVLTGDVAFDSFFDFVGTDDGPSALAARYSTQETLMISFDDGDAELRVVTDTAAGTTNWIADLLDDGVFDTNIGFWIHDDIELGLVALTTRADRLTKLFLIEDLDNPVLSQAKQIGDGTMKISSIAVQPGAGLTAVSRGTGKGVVKLLDVNGAELAQFTAQKSGGAKVAFGDFDGDDVPDIFTGTGPGPVAAMKVWEGHELLNSGVALQDYAPWMPFGPNYKGGIFIAVGFISNSQYVDLVAGTESGLARVKVRSTFGPELGEIRPFGGAIGGVRVATADLNDDGDEEVIMGAGPGGRPRVVLFDPDLGDWNSGVIIQDFDAFNPNFKGGVFVAAADNTGDGVPDVIVGKGSGSPTVSVFDFFNDEGPFSFQAFPNFTGGARVGAVSRDDRLAHLIVGRGPGTKSTVNWFDDFEWAGPRLSLQIFGNGYTGGVYVAGTVSNIPPAVLPP